jgi:SAM-dependent methyltransferase
LTREYYNKYAKEYFEKTKDSIHIELLNSFLKLIWRDEKILDLGCGSGNNLKFMKERGYNVIGVDNATALIQLAKDFSNAEIYNFDIADANSLNCLIKNMKVRHLYANASLLHLSQKEFLNFMNTIEVEGYFFVSLKEGNGEAFDKFGRFFVYYTKEKVEKILRDRFNIIYFDVTEDGMKRELNWLNWIVKL